MMDGGSCGGVGGRGRVVAGGILVSTDRCVRPPKARCALLLTVLLAYNPTQSAPKGTDCADASAAHEQSLQAGERQRSANDV